MFRQLYPLISASWHMPSCSGLLVIAINLTAKEGSLHGSHFILYCKDITLTIPRSVTVHHFLNLK